MAHWHMRAQVIDLGTRSLFDDHLMYHGFKVVGPDGKRRFIGKVITHNEVGSVLEESYGETVDLYFSGPKKGSEGLLYGIKSDNEDAYYAKAPYGRLKFLMIISMAVSVPLCFVMIGLLMLPLCTFCLFHLRSFDPPSRKFFDAHAPQKANSRVERSAMSPAPMIEAA